MRYTLKDFQDDASRLASQNLEKAGRRWREEDELSSFGLSAITGAGKTVIAADVLETLFFGSEENQIAPDDTATVLWFSNDPVLNDQSRTRLEEASDLLQGRTETISTSFEREKLDRGKIYFLNTQKLSSGTKMMKQLSEKSLQGTIAGIPSRATFFDTLNNTINDDQRTLYLIIDEAHQGSRDNTKENETIISKLINGDDEWGNQPMPVVMGISATLGRFSRAMDSASDRSKLSDVRIDPADVQESGLLKTNIELNIPGDDDNSGRANWTLLTEAASRLNSYTNSWAGYCATQNMTEAVVPLMVLQVAPKTSEEEIGSYLDIIARTLHNYSEEAVVHVLENHKPMQFGDHLVDYMAPDLIQRHQRVRVVVAKESVVEGWDCPRAEVMVSLRTAKSGDYITQLIGRLLRNPLARLVEGDDVLNSIYCSLPFFDRDSVEDVKKVIVDGENVEWGSRKSDSGRRVLINPISVYPNEEIEDDVWDALDDVKTINPVKRRRQPVRRFTSLAHALVMDDIRANASSEAQRELARVMDIEFNYRRGDVEAKMDDIANVRTTSVILNLEDKTSTSGEFQRTSSEETVRESFKTASRRFGKIVANSYVNHVVAERVKAKYDGQATDSQKLSEIRDARIRVSAMAHFDEIVANVNDQAQSLSSRWFEEHRTSIKKLTDERQAIYSELQAMTGDVEMIEMIKPRSRMVKTHEDDGKGNEVALPTFKRHLLSDERGDFPMDFASSSWEEKVLRQELADDDVIAWYRNPSSDSMDSLGIVYQHGKDQKIVRPDFVFFVRRADGSVAPYVVDPHGTHYEDALPKLIGLCDYAEEHADSFIRFDAVAEVKREPRVLDLTRADVRERIRTWSGQLSDLYTCEVSGKY